MTDNDTNGRILTLKTIKLVVSKYFILLFSIFIFTNPLPMRAESFLIDLFTPNRILVGVGQSTTRFSTEEFNTNEVKVICVTDSPSEETSIREGGEVEKCSNDGFDSYRERARLTGWLEFKPAYFGDTSFGMSLFFTRREIETTLLDYPLNNEETDIKVQLYSANPTLFFTIGDKDLGQEDGVAFRFGYGISLSYVDKFELTRISTGEKYEASSGINTIGERSLTQNGLLFADFNWSNLFLVVENSVVISDEKKFDDVKQDYLTVSNTFLAAGYSFYFQ